MALRINDYELDHAVPESEGPVKVERYFIQISRRGRRKKRGQPAVDFWGHWFDARLDVNMTGMREEQIALSCMERLRDDKFYGEGTRWRVIRRICLIYTEIAAE